MLDLLYRIIGWFKKRSKPECLYCGEKFEIPPPRPDEDELDYIFRSNYCSIECKIKDDDAVRSGILDG